MSLDGYIVVSSESAVFRWFPYSACRLVGLVVWVHHEGTLIGFNEVNMLGLAAADVWFGHDWAYADPFFGSSWCSVEVDPGP
jgi:hypothetical protein